MYKEVLQQALKQFQKSSSQSENRKLLHDMYNYWAAKYAFFLSRVSMENLSPFNFLGIFSLSLSFWRSRLCVPHYMNDTGESIRNDKLQNSYPFPYRFSIKS